MTENQLLPEIRKTERIQSPNSSTSTMENKQIKSRENKPDKTVYLQTKILLAKAIIKN
jgi:hypothetical protein